MGGGFDISILSVPDAGYSRNLSCVPHLYYAFICNKKNMMPRVEQELLTLPEFLSPPPFCIGIRFIRWLVLCVCFVDRSLSVCLFSFGHCVVCPSSIYGFWLPLWYCQRLLYLIMTGHNWGKKRIICYDNPLQLTRKWWRP